MPATSRQTPPMDIRPARHGDAAEVGALLRQLGYTRTTDEVGRSIRTAAADPDCTILVASPAGSGIAGCLQVVVTRRLAEGDRAEIASLVVDSNWRRRSIGARLIQAAVEKLKAQGISDLRVRCNVKRESAHQFYERFGFRRTKTQKVFDLPLDSGSVVSDPS